MAKQAKILRTEILPQRRVAVLSRLIGMCSWEQDGHRCKRPVSRQHKTGKKYGLCPMHYSVWRENGDG